MLLPLPILLQLGAYLLTCAMRICKFNIKHRSILHHVKISYSDKLATEDLPTVERGRPSGRPMPPTCRVQTTARRNTMSLGVSTPYIDSNLCSMIHICVVRRTVVGATHISARTNGAKRSIFKRIALPNIPDTVHTTAVTEHTTAATEHTTATTENSAAALGAINEAPTATQEEMEWSQANTSLGTSTTFYDWSALAHDTTNPSDEDAEAVDWSLHNNQSPSFWHQIASMVGLKPAARTSAANGKQARMKYSVTVCVFILYSMIRFLI
jgi:hypothetical protein